MTYSLPRASDFITTLSHRVTCDGTLLRSQLECCGHTLSASDSVACLQDVYPYLQTDVVEANLHSPLQCPLPL